MKYLKLKLPQKLNQRKKVGFNKDQFESKLKNLRKSFKIYIIDYLRYFKLTQSYKILIHI